MGRDKDIKMHRILQGKECRPTNKWTTGLTLTTFYDFNTMLYSTTFLNHKDNFYVFCMKDISQSNHRKKTAVVILFLYNILAWR
jgi:hypothetical protein